MTDEIPNWAKDFKPRQNAKKPQETVIATPIDIDDPVALRQLAKSVLVEIVQTAPRNVSLVAAIRELLDRVDGKPVQAIDLDATLRQVTVNATIRFADDPCLIIEQSNNGAKPVDSKQAIEYNK